MALHPCTGWFALVGARVEIRNGGRTVRAGTVEDAMPDSSVLWLAADGNQPRALYEAAEGYEAWTEPNESEGPDRYRYTADRLFLAAHG